MGWLWVYLTRVGKGSCSIVSMSKMPLVKKCNTTMKISKVLLDNRVKALKRK